VDLAVLLDFLTLTSPGFAFDLLDFSSAPFFVGEDLDRFIVVA
jgi:hypothetical protein